MWKYAIVLSYFGSPYCGWQRQKGNAGGSKPSIQGTLEEALQKITRENPSVVGSGRTDAGVHALGQVAHFLLREKEWDPQILHRSLNGLLPSSIQVLHVQSVAIDFHAQRSALKKQYSYYFQQGPCAIPHFEPMSWWIRKRLNLEAMRIALQTLVGEHDFKPFQASGSKPGSTVRAILEAEVTTLPIPFPLSAFSDSFPAQNRLELVRVRVMGTGFLKQMVRGIAGTLLQVGEDRRPPQCMSEILETGDRAQVGPTAPARALWLERVWYPNSSISL